MVNENTKTAKITDSLRQNLCGTLAYKDLMIKGTEKITVKRNVIFKQSIKSQSKILAVARFKSKAIAAPRNGI